MTGVAAKTRGRQTRHHSQGSLCPGLARQVLRPGYLYFVAEAVVGTDVGVGRSVHPGNALGRLLFPGLRGRRDGLAHAPLARGPGGNREGKRHAESPVARTISDRTPRCRSG